MNLKTITASSMPAALAKVKEAVGADAVILHTRTYKRGGLFGSGARTVVKITAARGAEVARHRERRRSPAAAERARSAGPQRASARDAGRGEGEPNGTAGDLIRRTYLAAQAELQSRQPRAAPDPQVTATIQRAPAVDAPRQTRPPAAAVPMPGDELADELRVVKRMVAKMVRQQRQPGRGGQRAASSCDLPDKLFDQYLALLQQEVAEELAEDIIQQVRAQVTPQQMDSEEAVRMAIARAITRLLPTDDEPAAPTPASTRGPRVIALIGPTGVGKTTTIAKLAANFKLREKKKVGLLTIDTYRIAAVDQLRTYAGIIGVPLHVIKQPPQMADAIRRCADCDAVLIDTAGRSQRDDPKLAQLQAFLDAADPHEVHLVLSSTCTQSALEDVIERFNRIRVDRIIFTKLDEAVTFGVLLNVTRKVRKGLSYFTTGQEVPHQIERGRSDRLAALVLGEGL